MNWGLAKWAAMLALLIWSCFSFAIGASLVALLVFGIIDLWLGGLGAFMVVKASVTLWYTYNWFTADV